MQSDAAFSMLRTCQLGAQAGALSSMKFRYGFAFLVILLASPAAADRFKHPFTFEDMMNLQRMGEPIPSPDGKWVVFDAQEVDLRVNSKISHLWIVPTTGGQERRLSQTANHEERPRFSPDGK